MVGAGNPRRRPRSAEGLAWRETGTDVGNLEIAPGHCVRWTETITESARRRIALLAVVREAVPLLPALPYLPLPHFSNRFCQPYCTVHSPDYRTAGHQSPARIPDRTIHPRRGSKSSSEEGRYTYDGRSVDCNFHRHPHVVVGGPDQSIRMDCSSVHLRICSNRIRRRLHEGGAPAQSGIDRES